MTNEDINKWLNDELPESESAQMTDDIMAELKEFRLKQAFKQRLEAQRRQRIWINRTIVAAVILIALALLAYFWWLNQQSVSSQNVPSNTYGFTDKPIAEQKSLDSTEPKNDDFIQKNKDNKPILVDSTLTSTPNAPFNPPSFIQKPAQTALPTIKPFAKPPIDTEYVYMTSSEKRPVYFYTSAENVKDTFTILDLSKEKLTEIPPSVFPYTQLKILLLNRNQLAFLSKDIAKLTHLEQLDASRNKLTALPEAFTQLMELKSLNLETNKLKALPNDIGQLSNLKILNLESNKLTSLPQSIGQLTQLTELNVSDNLLNTLPNEWHQLSNLATLNLNQNELKELPNDIYNLANLTVLNANHNKIWKINTTIGNLKNLKTLDLSHNYLRQLPKEIANLKNLIYLDLRENHFDFDEIRRIKMLLPNCQVDH